jgi:hypothetical protein
LPAVAPETSIADSRKRKESCHDLEVRHPNQQWWALGRKHSELIYDRDGLGSPLTLNRRQSPPTKLSPKPVAGAVTMALSLEGWGTGADITQYDGLGEAGKRLVLHTEPQGGRPSGSTVHRVWVGR